MILDLVSACGNKGLANLIGIAKTALTIIQVAGPILAMIGLVSILIKLMSNPENKKLKNSVKNWLIAFLMLFFIPTIVNVVMGLLDDTYTITACWNYAENSKVTGEATYIPPTDEHKQSILGDPGNYDEGDEREQGSEGASSPTTQNTSISKYIFIGDSRTVGMHAAVNTNDVWSAKSGQGLTWMKQTGVPQVESSISSGAAVIILMGVNDLYKLDSYISYINGKAPDWTNKGAHVYFVSVLPTDGKYNKMNSEINSFNKKMKSNLSSSVTYIDTSSYLKSNGFKTTDGLHYDNATYKKIYNHIKNSI